MAKKPHANPIRKNILFGLVRHFVNYEIMIG